MCTRHLLRLVRPISSLPLLALLAAPLLTPATTRAQGWIEQTVPGSSHVERVESRIQVFVQGLVARVEVDEWFVNQGGRVAEGHYLYPVPAGVALSGVSLFQGEQELRGEVMDAEQARRIYEEIVRRRLDPALIEYMGEGLFRARVFPIEPGERRRVTLRYTQVLPSVGASLHFKHVGATRPGPSRPEHAAAPVELELRATPQRDFLTPFSPTHALGSERLGDTLVVRASESPIGRISVFLPRSGDVAGLTVLTHRSPGEDGFALLSLTPPDAPSGREPRDLAVVLDVSGSMAGDKIEQARSAVLGLIDGLGPDDRFRLISFSNGLEVHSGEWVRATRAARRSARAWVERLRADGGTNLHAALGEAFRLAPGPERLPVVIFLTDGLPTVGEQDPNRIASSAESHRGRFRVFAFGVGHDVNTRLLDRISDATRGTTQYVEPGESVERALSLLAARISHPVLTDLELEGAPVELRDLYPVRIPDVFAGESLVLLARYRGVGSGQLTIAGRRAGRIERLVARTSFEGEQADNSGLPKLWAARKIGHLTRQLMVEGENEALVEEIRATALRYGLPSPFTSILVQEPGIVTDLPAPNGRPMAARVAGVSSGVTAVKVAEAARRFRELDDAAELEEMRAEVAFNRADADVRLVAGRVFRERDGVWTDAEVDRAMPEVQVARFSPAWFELVEAMPELAEPARAFEHVELSGRRLRLTLGAEGIERWGRGELERVVHDFRSGAS